MLRFCQQQQLFSLSPLLPHSVSAFSCQRFWPFPCLALLLACVPASCFLPCSAFFAVIWRSRYAQLSSSPSPSSNSGVSHLSHFAAVAVHQSQNGAALGAPNRGAHPICSHSLVPAQTAVAEEGRKHGQKESSEPIHIIVAVTLVSQSVQCQLCVENKHGQRMGGNSGRHPAQTDRASNPICPPSKQIPTRSLHSLLLLAHSIPSLLP